MKTIYHLVCLQLNEKLRFFKKNGFLRTLFFTATLILGVYLASYMLIYIILPFQAKYGLSVNDRLLTLILFFIIFLNLLLSIGKIITNLYLSKDNEIIMSFPTTNNEVFFSKMITIYITEIINNSIYCYPIFMWYGLATNPTSTYFLRLLVFLLILPLLAISLAGLISVPIMKFVQFLRTKMILMIATITILSASAIFLYSYVIAKISVAFDMNNKIESMIKFNAWVYNTAPKLKPIMYMVEAISGNDFFGRMSTILLVVLAISLVSFLIVKLFFFKLAMTQQETGGEFFHKVKGYKHSKPMASLIKKDFLAILRNPSYVFQYFLFALLMPFIVLAYDKLLIDVTVNELGTVMIFGAHVLVLAIFTMLSNLISASAISLEGGSFYIMKVAPISYKMQIIAKILFNLIITGTSIVITSLVVIIGLKMSIWQVILVDIGLIIAAIGNICLNIEMDLRKPSLDWYDSSEIKEVSKTTTKALVYSFIWGIILGCIMFLTASSSSNIVSIILLFIVATLFTLFRIYCLFFRTDLFFERIEI